MSIKQTNKQKKNAQLRTQKHFSPFLLWLDLLSTYAKTLVHNEDASPRPKRDASYDSSKDRLNTVSKSLLKGIKEKVEDAVEAVEAATVESNFKRITQVPSFYAIVDESAFSTVLLIREI